MTPLIAALEHNDRIPAPTDLRLESDDGTMSVDSDLLLGRFRTTSAISTVGSHTISGIIESAKPLSPGVVVAISFISEDSPERIGTAIEIPYHAWFFRFLPCSVAGSEVGLPGQHPP
jgi:hypothetical protein